MNDCRDHASNLELVSSCKAATSSSSHRVAALLDLVGPAALGARPARRWSAENNSASRLLARDPEILFLDEPTANLGPAATKAAEDVVVQVAGRGVKFVLATHDLGEARRPAGKAVLMVGGRVPESAPAKSFFDNPVTAEAQAFLNGDVVI